VSEAGEYNMVWWWLVKYSIVAAGKIGSIIWCAGMEERLWWKREYNMVWWLG